VGGGIKYYYMVYWSLQLTNCKHFFIYFYYNKN